MLYEFMFCTLLEALRLCTPVAVDTGKVVCSFCTVAWPKYVYPSPGYVAAYGEAPVWEVDVPFQVAAAKAEA